MKTTAERFQIEPTERALLVGRTGCGKSTLARSLLVTMPYVVVIDPKGEFDLPDGKPISDPNDLSKIRGGDPRPILYRPDPQFCVPAIFDSVFRWVYERRNCTLYVDELFAVMRNGIAPHYLQAVLTRGRSLKIRTLAATQRPFRIPLEILSESEHRFMFELNLQDDKKRMAELIGPEALQKLSGRHNFLYYYTYEPDTPATEFTLRKRGK